MDEPFASLDAQLRTLMQDELVTLLETERRTMVFVTHSIDEAIFLSDRIVVMSARPGTIRAERTVPFGRPRVHGIRADPAFGELAQEIWEIVKAEVDKSLERVPAGVADGAS